MNNYAQHESSLNLDEKLELLAQQPGDLSVQIKSDVPYATKTILDRNATLLKLCKWTVSGSMTMALTVIILVVALVVVWDRDPIVIEFALDKNNDIVRLQRSDGETVDDEDVLSFASDKVQEFHKLSFIDYIDHIVSLENEFTSAVSFDNYQISILETNILTTLQAENLVVWAEPISAPKIIDEPVKGRMWEVQMDFNWMMAGGKDVKLPSPHRATITIEAVARTHNEEGVAVSKYLVERLER